MSAPLQETEATITPVRAATAHQTKGDRFTSTNPADFPVPHSKNEDWRFTPLRRLQGLAGLGDVETFTGAAEVTVDTHEQEGIEVTTRESSDERVGLAGAPVDRPAAAAWAQTPEAHYIRIAKDTVLNEPVTITVAGPGENETAAATIVVDAEDHSEAIVYLTYTGSGAVSDNVEFVTGTGAKLTVVVVEDWKRDAAHLSNSHILVGRDATVRHIYAAFGGDVVRSVPHVRYADQGGDAELLGIYFADAGQYFEQRLLVDHAIRNCKSNVLYKGALQGDTSGDETPSDARAKVARTAWIGDVLIRPEAQGTDTYEKNNNLILTEGARADSVPNLEIQTGEITGAGHAATVGRFDDEHMFYLQSRGIPRAEAKMLIVRGFFSDVIQRVPVESIRDLLESKVEAELRNTVL